MTNAEIALTNSAAFSRKDLDAMMEFYAPDVVVTDRRAVGWGEFRGRESVHSYYEGIFDNVAEINEDMQVVEERGDVVIGACEMRARLVDTPREGGEVMLSYVLRITVEGGLITAMDIFEDVESAAAAA